MRSPGMFALAAVVALTLWIILTFVMTLRTGWTHLALVAAVLLAVVSIVEGVDRPSSRDDNG